MTDTRVLSGRYRITGHLARGGMADVHQAEDISLGRQVAIKILHPQFAADEAFVTGTFAGLAPVREIDGRIIGNGERGPMVERLQQLYLQLLERECR